MINRVLAFRAGMQVRRYHVMNLHVPETVGHHSSNVAWLVTVLCPNPSAALIQAALLHDVAEQWTGDVPATAKWASQSLKGALDDLESQEQERADLVAPLLTEGEELVLKQADMLDLCFKMVEEIRMGNIACVPVLLRGIDYLERHNPLPATIELIYQLEDLCQKQINVR